MEPHQTPPNDNQRHGATDPEVRDAEVFIDTTTYSLDLQKISSRFIASGVHRTIRSLQRYCENGSIGARKYNTAKGVLWLANPESVDLKIKEIIELEKAAAAMSATDDDTATAPDMSSTDVSHNLATPNDTTINEEPRQSFADASHEVGAEALQQPTTTERQSTSKDDDRYLTVPVGVLDALTDQLAEKDKQIERRDQELQRMSEEREQDRQLLVQALNLIHGEDFVPALESKKEKPRPIELHSEIKPEPPNRNQEREGDNPQSSFNNFSV